MAGTTHVGSRQAGPNPAVVWTMAGAAVASIVAGSMLMVRAIPPRAVPASDQKAQPMVHDRKPPSAFGLPAYPGAFGFHSMESGPERGSSAFSVRSGTAGRIAAFYRSKFEPSGWRLQWQRREIQRPGNLATRDRPAATGVRVRWTNPDRQRQMTLVALDYKEVGSTAQVVLMWSPLAGSAGTLPAGVRDPAGKMPALPGLLKR